MSSKTVLSARFKDDSLIEAGIDEAGRGCFWGPIMAGAVVWQREDFWSDAHRELMPNVKDSKKIAPKKRMKVAEEIQRLAQTWAVGSVSAKEIDENGITWANQEAFRRAIDGLRLEPDRIIIDGALHIPDYAKEQHVIVEGDGKYLHVAAASILAKVAHDIWVTDYCAANPQCEERYSLLSSHGYGTEKHRNGLRSYGAHELHRSTFIYNWLPDSEKTCALVKGVKGVKPLKPVKHANTIQTEDNQCLIRLPPA